jgi:hypothetical protein
MAFGSVESDISDNEDASLVVVESRVGDVQRTLEVVWFTAIGNVESHFSDN